MVINQLSFSEFYDYFRRNCKYEVLITFIARTADAIEQYNEILKHWSSFHDLTGDHVAFVFAGQSTNTKQSLGWYKNGKMARVPDSIYIPKFMDLALEQIPKSPSYLISPQAPESSEFHSNQTLRTREIKAALDIQEAQIPCLHFLFTHSNTSQIVPMSDLKDSLYSFFKSLFDRWDKSFENLDTELDCLSTLFQKQSKQIGRHNTSVGNTKNLFKRLHEMTLSSNNQMLKNELERLLLIIKTIPEKPEARRDAFDQIKKIKLADPTVITEIVADFNRMIDWAPFLQLEPINYHFNKSLVYYELDEALSKTIRELIYPGSFKLTEMGNESIVLRPLKAFISYSKFDGESNISGVNLLEQFKNMMTPLSTYQNLIQTWDDTRLIAGEEWDNQIKSELETSDIIFLLISNNFLATKYIREIELATAIKRHNAGECEVIPIILSACGWNEIPMLAKLNGIPRKGHTITSWRSNLQWHSMEDAWYHVFLEVKRVILSFNDKKSKSS